VRDCDGDEAGRVAACLPGRERGAQLASAAVVDLGGAGRAQPDVAAGLQAAVVSAAVLDPNLNLRADRDNAAVALPFWCVGIGCRYRPQVHPRAAAPSGGIVAGHQGVVRNFGASSRGKPSLSSRWKAGSGSKSGCYG
jgi:hypothetical protein